MDGRVGLEGNARFTVAYKENLWQEITLKELPETPGGWGQSGITLEGKMGRAVSCSALQAVGQQWLKDWSAENAVPQDDLDGRDPIFHLGKTLWS